VTVRAIRTWPDPVLSSPCGPVGRVDDEIRALAADMFETMYAAPGRGLAAPQVGVSLRLFVMDTGWKEGQPAPVAMIDPEIEWRSEERVEGPEGCLSIPGVAAAVTRHAEIGIGWTDLSGARQRATLSGFDAICAQHEYDHLDGIVTFDRIGAEERARLEAEYRG
jgi:peptide deformylase